MDSIRADSVGKDSRSLGAMLDSSSEPVVLADSHALASIGIFEHRHLTTQVTINKVYHIVQSGERDVDRASRFLLLSSIEYQWRQILSKLCHISAETRRYSTRP
jgi:hypothetical protein